jgi:hypothetical protein
MKSHIQSWLLIEVRLMFSIPAQIIARSSYRSANSALFIWLNSPMWSSFSPTKAARGLKFINASNVTTGIVRCLAARCTDGSETSRGEGENGPRNDFKSRDTNRSGNSRGISAEFTPRELFVWVYDPWNFVLLKKKPVLTIPREAFSGSSRLLGLP